MNEKDIEKRLKKDIKNRDGGLPYSLSPMQWDARIKQQAADIYKSQLIQSNADRLRKEMEERHKQQREAFRKTNEEIFKRKYGTRSVEDIRKKLDDI